MNVSPRGFLDPDAFSTAGERFPAVFLIAAFYCENVTMWTVLSGAGNDASTLETVLLMAARQGYGVKVILRPSFPRVGFLKMLDATLGRVALAGVPAPHVMVERERVTEGQSPGKLA